MSLPARPRLMPPSFPPEWASEWGTDVVSRYPFVGLTLREGVVLRFRWIPPGRFKMGSPESEAG
jgi:formylglycine-generating enzyme